jgi:hypothetical protein
MTARPTFTGTRLDHVDAVAARDQLGVLDVAHDLVELGDLLEAEALLCDELPTRHDVNCPACGAIGVHVLHDGKMRPGVRCREPGLVTCRHCKGAGRRTEFALVLDEGDPPPTKLVRCRDCNGRGQVESLVDRIVPHESRIR